MLPARVCTAPLVVSIVLSPLLSAAANEPQKHQTLIAVSKSTTVLTEPLDEEGYVDFLAAVNQRLSEGVTPENNAAVLLRASLGLMEVKGNQAYRDRYDQMLGIEPAGDGLWVPLMDVARQDGKGVDEAYELLSAAHERPWTADEFPTIAAWLSANAAALEMVVEATERPRFYTPYIAAANGAPKMVSVLLPALHETREAARALLARALWHAGEGDAEKAFRDLEATHRLARLVSQDPTIIGGLVGIAIDGVADQGDLAIVSTGNYEPEMLRSYLDRLNRLPSFPHIADRLDFIERIMFVDVVVSLARGRIDQEAFALIGLNNQAGAGLLAMVPRFAMGSVDWNSMLREGNGWYDRIVEAMEEETFAEQTDALKAIDADVKSLAEGARSPLRLAAIVLSDHKTRGQLVGKQIGESLVALLLPATHAATTAEHRGQMKFDLSRVAVALEVFRGTTGEYPSSLDALTLDVLKEIPRDRFNSDPLRYELRDDGYLLYSVGMNGKDDGATSYISGTRKGEHVPQGQVESEEGDDLVVRVPLP